MPCSCPWWFLKVALDLPLKDALEPSLVEALESSLVEALELSLVEALELSLVNALELSLVVALELSLVDAFEFLATNVALGVMMYVCPALLWICVSKITKWTMKYNKDDLYSWLS